MTECDPIWAVNVGDSLQARVTLRMEDGDQEQVFTEGRLYAVVRVMPLRMPAVAVVIDDTGRENKIEASFLHNFVHLAK